jgi:hypothetical protein
MRTAVLLAALALPAAAGAQAPDRTGVDRTGVALGLRALSAGVGAENPNVRFQDGVGSEGGLGVELSVAYGFTPTLAAFVALGGADVEGDDPGVLGGYGYGLGVADLGLRLNARPSARVNPYATAALTGLAAASDGEDGPEAAGGGLSLGAGVDVALARSLLLDLGLGLTGGEFSDFAGSRSHLDGDEPFGAAVARIGLGLRYAP